MAHHIATPEFDHVAFDKWYDGRPRWESSPRTIATAKAKARREGYTNFYVAHSDHPKAHITTTMRIVRYVYDAENGTWIYS